MRLIFELGLEFIHIESMFADSKLNSRENLPFQREQQIAFTSFVIHRIKSGFNSG